MNFLCRKNQQIATATNEIFVIRPILLAIRRRTLDKTCGEFNFRRRPAYVLVCVAMKS
jgi:hypothetical protein